MTSRLLVRIAGLALAVGVVWYITHLNAEIARMKAAGPAAPAAAPAAPAAAPAPAGGAATQAAAGTPRSITADQKAAMLSALGGASETSSGEARPVWFATVPNNPEATAYQKELQAVFEEAGWQVRGTSTVRFPMKPGIYIFAADEEPPDYLGQVNQAFEAAGIPVTSGRGYREYVQQKKQEDPNWVGLELGPEDTYVIAVGRAG
jgi:hypothetical protein